LETSLISSVSTAGQRVSLPRNLTFRLINIESVDVPDSLARLFVMTMESTAVAREVVCMNVSVSVHREVVVQAVQFILGRCVLLDGLEIDRLVHLRPFGSESSEMVIPYLIYIPLRASNVVVPLGQLQCVEGHWHLGLLCFHIEKSSVLGPINNNVAFIRPVVQKHVDYDIGQTIHEF